ncbi:hypothetical protein JB92DRAFT_545287 [Gautieria morchelliformis]|nr:hypothetical protein JB92DRAFT_545287 [Gautieria morchelliformis]
MSSPSASVMPQLTEDQLVTTGQGVLATKYYLCAAFTILLYDHMLSFADEVKYIWARPRELVSGLFLFVRYFTPVVLIIDMLAFFNTNWSIEMQEIYSLPTISRWRRRPRPSRTTARPPVRSFHVYPTIYHFHPRRVYAIYNRSRFVLSFLCALIAGQVIVGLWQFLSPGSTPIPFPRAYSRLFYICIFTTAPSLPAPSAYLSIGLAFDICVFALTMAKTWQGFLLNRGPKLLRRISQDGALYFLLIFSANAVWLFMSLYAPVQIKTINILPATVLNVTMINRLTMNLRSTPAQEVGESEDQRVSTLIFGWRSRTRPNMLDKRTNGTRIVESQFSSSAGASSSYELEPVRE